MKKSATLLIALLVFSAQFVFTQTRARRVEQVAPTPSPTPPTSGPANTANKDAQPSAHNPPSDQVAEADVLRINTTLVSVPVSVTDQNGRYLPDLQKQDFHIYEDGVEQEIAYFASVEKPCTVILLLDTSASTWSKLGQIKDAAKTFVDQLRPNDQVGVISFGMGVKVQSEPTSDRKRIRKGIESTGRGLSTRLYDAMDKVMKKYLDRIPGRKAVVLFTDGVDATSNNSTYESTLHTAEELDALIYSIRYDTYDPAADKGNVPDPLSGLRLPSILRKIPLPSIGTSSGGGAGSSRADYERGERYLHELAELTGGRVYEASKDLRYLRTAFSSIADELGRQYLVGYYPRKKGSVGQRRRIKVKVDKPDVAIRARDGYIYKGSNDATENDVTNSEPKQSPSPPVLKKKPFVAGK